MRENRKRKFYITFQVQVCRLPGKSLRCHIACMCFTPFLVIVYPMLMCLWKFSRCFAEQEFANFIVNAVDTGGMLIEKCKCSAIKS